MDEVRVSVLDGWVNLRDEGADGVRLGVNGEFVFSDALLTTEQAKAIALALLNVVVDRCLTSSAPPK